MLKMITGACVLVLAGASILTADFSYQESSAVTGGALAGVMKVASVFSKSAGAPIRNTVLLKGNKMMQRSENSATLIDLDAQTFTSIDFQKKTYSVMTFDQMRQAMEDALKKMKNSKNQPSDMNFKVSVDDTGKTRQIAGFDAKEMVLRMEMQGTDKKSGESGAMYITTDMWIAPVAAGYAEVRDFQRRMAEKIAWSPSGNMFMAQPEVANGMANAAKEVAKIDGIPVLQVMSMGATPQTPNAGAADAKPAQVEEPKPEKQGIGGALGRLGGLGGLGRKKAEPQPEQNTAATGSLVEMRTEMTNFSNASIDDSQLAIPAGFKKIDAKM
jgi:hypothetical protein